MTAPQYETFLTLQERRRELELRKDRIAFLLEEIEREELRIERRVKDLIFTS